MSDRWARCHEQCATCGTRRRPHARRGYCKLCVKWMRLIWAAEKWDQSRPDTLRTVPDLHFTYDALKAGIDRCGMNAAEFERFRAEVIRQHTAFLAVIKHRESKRPDAPTGWDIEGALVYVARNMRPAAAGRFHGAARGIQDGFSDAQRQTIYGWLLDLTEHLLQPTLNVQELWRRVCPPDSISEGMD